MFLVLCSSLDVHPRNAKGVIGVPTNKVGPCHALHFLIAGAHLSKIVMIQFVRLYGNRHGFEKCES
jgi:hypothetical protein